MAMFFTRTEELQHDPDCWKFVNSTGRVEDCPGGDVLASGKSIHELFRLGWESVREDLTDGGTLVCLRFREHAPPVRWPSDVRLATIPIKAGTRPEWPIHSNAALSSASRV
jgi:hypothetical protein